MIDHYTLGQVIVDGVSYRQDLIIICQGKEKKVIPNWWRKEGHLLQIEDLTSLWEIKPRYLVVGTGAYGVMKVDQRVMERAKELGIQIFIAKTAEAVEIFNQLLKEKSSLACALHLTC